MNVFSKLERTTRKKIGDGKTIFTTVLYREYIEELVRVLKPGGRIIIGEYYYPLSEVFWLSQFDFNRFGLTDTRLEGEQMNDFFTQERIHLWFIDRESGNSEPFVLVLEKREVTP